MKTFAKIVAVVSTIFLICAFIYLLFFLPREIKVKEKITTNIDSTIISLDLWQTIIQSRLEHPAVCYRHSQLETGNWTDTLSVHYNNYFGMQYARKRPTTQFGWVVIKGVKWGRYLHWRDSVYDYLIWQIMYARGLSEEQYIEKLYKVYGSKNIKSHLNK